MKQDIFNLKNGAVILSWPDFMDEEDVEFLKEFLELELRQIERSVKKKMTAETVAAEE